MRIVVDMQGGQRDVPLYGLERERLLSLFRALVELQGEHQVFFALNGAFPEHIVALRKAFEGRLPREHLRVWYPPSGRPEQAEKVREAFMATLNPDVLFVPDFFSDYDDESVTGLEVCMPSVPTLLGLPDGMLLESRLEWDPEPQAYRAFYERKCALSKKADAAIALLPQMCPFWEEKLGKSPGSLQALYAQDASGEIDFSQSAKQLLLLLESLVRGREESKGAVSLSLGEEKPRMAYVSPLPPEKTGIAAYSAKILRLLARYYDITVVVTQREINDPWVWLYCNVRTPEWFLKECHAFDRVVYHFGNSPFHFYMLELLEKKPGVVFLHDASLSGLLEYRNQYGSPSSGTKELYGSHGYKALEEYYNCHDVAELSERYPMHFGVIQNSRGVVVHNPAFLDVLKRWYGEDTAEKCLCLPISESAAPYSEKSSLPPWVETVESFYRANHLWPQGALDILKKDFGQRTQPFSDPELSEALEHSFPAMKAQRELFVDVSVLCREDFRTGIQRVARALLLGLLKNPPKAFRVEPVYLTNLGGTWHYRHARKYMLELLGCPGEIFEDGPVQFRPQDILFCPDLAVSMTLEAEKDGLFDGIRQRGTRTVFMVHDILPVTLPRYFAPGVNEAHARWLEIVAKMDCLVCVSQAVARDVSTWIKEYLPERYGVTRVEWSHHGADFRNSFGTTGLPEGAALFLAQLESLPTFLMVGTIEPRKAHRQVFEAFSLLWDDDVECDLVIVGKKGWMVDSFVQAMEESPHYNKYLFWLQGISDEYLEAVYRSATCLIFASEGEGFGLPLIEAAQHGLPLLVRDIPVFREVAGEGAFYFSANTPEELAEEIKNWLVLYRRDAHPVSASITWLSWEESAERLKKALTQGI